MSWRAICIGLTLGLALASAGPATGRSALPCGPASASTIAVDAQARVYTSGGVFGCAQGSPKRVALGGSTSSCLGSVRIGPVALAGVTAGYAAERCGIDTGSSSVVVRRLSDGHQLASVSAGTPPGPEAYTSVTAIVVRLNGAAGWISVSRSLATQRTTVEVWRAVNGAARRLDAGPGIAQHSLRLYGRRLTWRNGGRTRSATLG